MRRIILVTSLFLFAVAAIAQQDQKAREILDKVTQSTKSLKSMEATFSFEMENKSQNIKESKNGSIVLKGNKYKVLLSELGLEVYSDGKTVWTFMKEANEVNVSNLNGDTDEMMDPSKVFTMYQKGFNFKYIGEEVKNGKAVYVIELIPTVAKGSYSQITMHVDKAKMLICYARMKGKDGNMYTVAVNQFKTDKAFDDAYFTFNAAKHPGVDVIDMR